MKLAVSHECDDLDGYLNTLGRPVAFTKEEPIYWNLRESKWAFIGVGILITSIIVVAAYFGIPLQ